MSKHQKWQRWSGKALAAAVVVAAAFTMLVSAPTPVRAQLFPFLFQQRPQPYYYPQYEPQRPAQRPHVRPPAQPKENVDYTKAPAAHKPNDDAATKVVVFGDSMADWLAYGLEQSFGDTPDVGIIRRNRAFSGLIKYDARGTKQWTDVAREDLADSKPSIIVMMIGLSDRRSIQDDDKSEKSRGHAVEFRSDEWADLYGAKIDAMIAVLRSKGVPVIWVGMPSVRGTRSTSEFSYLNEIYRQHAEKAGITYVDIWDGFVDDNGRFTYSGPDVDGQIRRLRTGDGVHFTEAGARKLAHYVERDIRRLLKSPVTEPVALAPVPGADKPETGTKPGQHTRPAAGAVISLTGTPKGDTALLGGSAASPQTGNSLAARVLVKGDPVPPMRGRADDFSWAAGATVASTVPAENAAPATPVQDNHAADTVTASTGEDPGARPPKPYAVEHRSNKTAKPAPSDERKPAQPSAADAARRELTERRPTNRPAENETGRARGNVPRPPADVGGGGGRRSTNFFDPFGLFR